MNNNQNKLQEAFDELESQIKTNKKTISDLQSETNRLEIRQGKLAAQINYLKEQSK